jgi:hypothetical protein
MQDTGIASRCLPRVPVRVPLTGAKKRFEGICRSLLRLIQMESTVFDAALAVLLGFDTILDTMQSLVSDLRTRHYDSFIRRSRTIRG